MSLTLEAPTTEATREKPKRRKGLGFHGWMMTPGMLPLAALSFIPLFTIIAMSFSRVHLLGGVVFENVGFTYWARLFSDIDLWTQWLRTIVFFVFTVGLELVLGVVLALCLWKIVRARNVVLTLLLLPMFVAPVIVGLLGRFLTDSTFGLYTWALGLIGYHDDILGGGTSAFLAVAAMDIWEWTPLITLVVLAGLTSVPQSIREAASLDGVNGWQSLRHILLPSISGVLLVALLIRSMDAIRYFDIISVTTNGGPADATKTVPIRLYETAFRFFDFGYAAVIGLVMLVVTIVIARVFVRVLDKKGLAR